MCFYLHLYLHCCWYKTWPEHRHSMIGTMWLAGPHYIIPAAHCSTGTFYVRLRDWLVGQWARGSKPQAQVPHSRDLPSVASADSWDRAEQVALPGNAEAPLLQHSSCLQHCSGQTLSMSHTLDNSREIWHDMYIYEIPISVHQWKPICKIFVLFYRKLDPLWDDRLW